jgi:hypothetical protein
MRRLVPVLTLAILAPLLTEVIFGSTPISTPYPFVFILYLFWYGGGALIIREIARRKGFIRWPQILILGAAFALTEDGLVLQDLFVPKLFGIDMSYGRALGVNWGYGEFMVLHHALISIAIPILLAELIFYSQQSEPWLVNWGLGLIVSLFLLTGLGLFVIWVSINAGSGYHPQLLTSLIAASVIAGLIALAFALRFRNISAQAEQAHNIPNLWVLRAAGFLTALLIYAITAFAGTVIPVPAPIAMLAMGLIVLGAWGVIQRWSRMKLYWNDSHRLALSSGVVIAVAIYGLAKMLQAGSTIDVIGIVILSTAMLALLIFLAKGTDARLGREL